jgi:hypothetical protein
MTMLATDWLALAGLLCIAAWFANRRFITILLPFAAIIAAYAVYLPTGSPRFTNPPAGKYTVLGADIQVNVAIYALLKPENGPAVYYKLKYSTSEANALQAALDGAENGQGVQANVDGEGGASFDGPPPVTGGHQPKVPETPAISIP